MQFSRWQNILKSVVCEGSLSKMVNEEQEHDQGKKKCSKPVFQDKTEQRRVGGHGGAGGGHARLETREGGPGFDSGLG